MTVEIVEILRRSVQGATEPFICRGADGSIYFVKGRAAGRASLVKEWISGKLAQSMNLPIAGFAIVDVPEELIALPSDLNLSDLGAGPAFGSRQRPLTTEITYSQLSSIPLPVRRDILMFDRWIRNYDRSLSEHGGNPNLLWAGDDGTVVIIDHNNAFDNALAGHDFAALHIFGDEFLALSADKETRIDYASRFDDALQSWGDIVASIPAAWRFLDAEQSVPLVFNLDEALGVLCEHRQEGFWSW